MLIGVSSGNIWEKIKIKFANMHIKNIKENSPMMELKKPKLQIRKTRIMMLMEIYQNCS